MNFNKLLVDLDRCPDGCADEYAAGIVNEVSRWAAASGYPDLVREYTPAARVVEAHRYIAACVEQTAEPDAMIDLATAAKLLGYKPAGLRKIVAATKAGKPGPTIQYAQVGKGPIRFRRQWLDDFINVVRPVKARPKVKHPPAESRHGFDNSLYGI